jgi:hypothetical protein
MNAKEQYKQAQRAQRIANRPDRATRLYVRRVVIPRNLALQAQIHAENALRYKRVETALDSLVHPAMLAA